MLHLPECREIDANRFGEAHLSITCTGNSSCLEIECCDVTVRTCTVNTVAPVDDEVDVLESATPSTEDRLFCSSLLDNTNLTSSSYVVLYQYRNTKVWTVQVPKPCTHRSERATGEGCECVGVEELYVDTWVAHSQCCNVVCIRKNVAACAVSQH